MGCMGLRLSMGCGAMGGGGGGSLPTSVTRFWGPGDMTFNGSNQLTAITDQQGDSSYIGINGTPTGNTTDGAAITEAGGFANHIYIDNVVGTTTGQHFAFLYRRNATADNAAMVLASDIDANRFFVGQSGNGTSPIGSNNSAGAAYHDGTTYASGTYTRDTIWTAIFNDTNWNVLAIEDFRQAVLPDSRYRLGAYNSGQPSFNFEGDIGGFATFTDWAERTSVETALLAEVGL